MQDTSHYVRSDSKNLTQDHATPAIAAAVATVDDSPGVLRDYLELAKPEITFLVVISALAGFLLGSPGDLQWLTLAVTAIGVALTSGGAAMLNHAVEAEWDGRMKRTAGRPIPMGRISQASARNTGFILAAAGIGLLCPLTNPLTAVLAGLAVVLYVYVYTPLKRQTHWNTLIGTLPGALPALGGWTAATGNLHAGGWAIFLILAVWQMPHFLALAWMYRKDYARGGFAMVSVDDDDGSRTSGQTLFYTALLVLVSILPFSFGTAGLVYVGGAVVLGAWFLVRAVDFRVERTAAAARRVLVASIYYIPLLVVFIVVDRLL